MRWSGGGGEGGEEGGGEVVGEAVGGREEGRRGEAGVDAELESVGGIGGDVGGAGCAEKPKHSGQ